MNNMDDIKILKDQLITDKGKGQQCSKGEKKNTIINRLNDLHNYNKYITNGSNIVIIIDSNNKQYNLDNIKQFLNTEKQKKNSIKKEIKINTTQLCCETELLLRYFDDENIDNKRWFFSTIEEIINKIG